MAAEIQDIIRANLVLAGLRLLNTPAELEAFKRAVKTDVQEVRHGPIVLGTTEPVRVFALHRDRITLELSPSHSAINRDYPLREDLPRLAEVAWQAINNTSTEGQHLQAAGFNIDLVFEQDSEKTAFEYLSQRLFGVEPSTNEGWRFVGGAGRLIFDAGVRQWTISMEPRFNDANESRVFVNANLHIAAQVLPTEKEIEAPFKEIWRAIYDFVQWLDTRWDRHD